MKLVEFNKQDKKRLKDILDSGKTIRSQVYKDIKKEILERYVFKRYNNNYIVDDFDKYIVDDNIIVYSNNLRNEKMNGKIISNKNIFDSLNMTETEFKFFRNNYINFNELFTFLDSKTIKPTTISIQEINTREKTDTEVGMYLSRMIEIIILTNKNRSTSDIYKKVMVAPEITELIKKGKITKAKIENYIIEIKNNININKVDRKALDNYITAGILNSISLIDNYIVKQQNEDINTDTIKLMMGSLKIKADFLALLSVQAGSKYIAEHEVEEIFNKKLNTAGIIKEMRNDLFSIQKAVYDNSKSGSNRNDAITLLLASRRAGKTEVASRLIIKNALKYPNKDIFYIANTMKQAKDLIYYKLIDLLDRFNLNYNKSDKEGKITILTENESKSNIYIMGLSNKAQLEKKRGYDIKLAIIDEAQSINKKIISTAIDEILLPSIMQNKGSLILAGTPSNVIKNNYFMEICLYNIINNKVPTDKEKIEIDFLKSNYYKIIENLDELELYKDLKLYNWNMLDNIFLDDPKRTILDIIKIKGLKEPDEQIYREYYGKIRINEKDRVFKDLANDIILTDEEMRTRVERYVNTIIVGFDVGFYDADAITVIGYDRFKQHKGYYIIYEDIATGQGNIDLLSKISKIRETLQAIYNKAFVIKSIIGDISAGGAKILQDLNGTMRNIGVIKGANKQGKNLVLKELVLLVERKEFFFLNNSQFYNDMQFLEWVTLNDGRQSTNSDQGKEFHSDIIDSTLYALNDVLRDIAIQKRDVDSDK